MTKDSEHLTWLPNVPRLTVACGILWLANVRLIRKENEHLNCFLVNGVLPIGDGLLVLFAEMTYLRIHVNTHAHMYDEFFFPAPNPEC